MAFICSHVQAVLAGANSPGLELAGDGEDDDGT